MRQNPLAGAPPNPLNYAKLSKPALPISTGRSLTTLREKLVKIGARLVRHARRLLLQMAEVVVTRDLFAQTLSRIRLLSPVPT